jgi:hypothetical protein
MRLPCPNPRCQDGTIATAFLSLPAAARGRSMRPGCRVCHTCEGVGTIEEGEFDLRSAGVVLWGATAEDFRSLPLHTFES